MNACLVICAEEYLCMETQETGFIGYTEGSVFILYLFLQLYIFEVCEYIT